MHCIRLTIYVTTKSQTQSSMKGIQIEQVKETKLLGVTVDINLSRSSHINNITKKMGIDLLIDNQEMGWVLNINLCGPGYPGTGSVPS